MAESKDLVFAWVFNRLFEEFFFVLGAENSFRTAYEEGWSTLSNVLGLSRWQLIRSVPPEITRAIEQANPGSHAVIDVPGE